MSFSSVARICITPLAWVAQVSKPAVSPISKSAKTWSCDGRRVGKPAIQQTGKSALRCWRQGAPSSACNEKDIAGRNRRADRSASRRNDASACRSRGGAENKVCVTRARPTHPRETRNQSRRRTTARNRRFYRQRRAASSVLPAPRPAASHAAFPNQSCRRQFVARRRAGAAREIPFCRRGVRLRWPRRFFWARETQMS